MPKIRFKPFTPRGKRSTDKLRFKCVACNERMVHKICPKCDWITVPVKE